MRKLSRSKTSRKRKKSRLDNLTSARSKIAEKKDKDISIVPDAKDISKVPAATAPKLSRRRIIGSKSRFQQSRKCVEQLETNAYTTVGIPRGKGGGYCASMRLARAQLRSVRALQSLREKNRDKNKNMKILSRAVTASRQDERRRVAKVAYDKLLQVCFLFYHYFFILITYHSLLLQVMRSASIKSRLEAVYDIEKDEKMSPAKTLHIVDRIPILVQYFKHYCVGKSKMEAQELAALGSTYSALWIGQMANEFIGTKANRQITRHTQVGVLTCELWSWPMVNGFAYWRTDKSFDILRLVARSRAAECECASTSHSSNLQSSAWAQTDELSL